jgi:hypothetical protein
VEAAAFFLFFFLMAIFFKRKFLPKFLLFLKKMAQNWVKNLHVPTLLGRGGGCCSDLISQKLMENSAQLWGKKK